VAAVVVALAAVAVGSVAAVVVALAAVAVASVVALVAVTGVVSAAAVVAALAIAEGAVASVADAVAEARPSRAASEPLTSKHCRSSRTACFSFCGAREAVGIGLAMTEEGRVGSRVKQCLCASCLL
jgi:hypothetical protein